MKNDHERQPGTLDKVHKKIWQMFREYLKAEHGIEYGDKKDRRALKLHMQYDNDFYKNADRFIAMDGKMFMWKLEDFMTSTVDEVTAESMVSAVNEIRADCRKKPIGRLSKKQAIVISVVLLTIGFIAGIITKG